MPPCFLDADVVVEFDDAFSVRPAVACVFGDAVSVMFAARRTDVAVEIDNAFAARLAAEGVVDDVASVTFSARLAAACAFPSR